MSNSISSSISNSISTFWRSLWLFVTAAYEADRRAATWMVLLTIVDAGSNAALALGLKVLVDAISHSRWSESMLAVTLIVASLLASQCVSLVNLTLGERLRELTGLVLDRRLVDLTAHLAEIEHYERADYLNELELLKDDLPTLPSVQSNFVTTLGMLVRIGLTLLLLGRIHPLLLLLPLFGLPSIWASFSSAQEMHHERKKVVALRRQELYFFYLAKTAAAAKELRIFGLGREILRRHRSLLDEMNRRMDTIQLKNAFSIATSWFIFGMGFIGAIIYVVERVIRHQATIGDVMLVMTLASQVNAQVAGLGNSVGRLFETVKTGERYLWLLDYSKVSQMRLARGDKASVPEKIRQGITLHNVSFRYPGTDKDILSSVNLHLPAGATVAIVGENGAGKTTLVKLLSRFYDIKPEIESEIDPASSCEPKQGHITLDGIDLSSFDIAEWRAHISAGFQDFVRFELLASEVVGIGDLANSEDREAVESALMRAHATDVITTLSDGLETQLGRSFQGGVELSGGQWQKLALGRAMMRPTPLLLILDEPTAALDAPTEHALFKQYTSAARRIGNETGAITLLISHRFSTVRMADLIVVINEHGIEEAGSHEELMTHDGLYARLYELQARAYR
jgi:ATP-binding cassette, subfamily B, bacterial